MGIGKRIKQVRGNLSREVFASKIGIDKSTVQRYEIYNNMPKGDVLERIYQEFDVNINWLFSGQGNMYIIKDEFNDQVGVGDSLDIEIKGSNGQGIKYNTGERQMLKSAAPDKPQHIIDQFGEASTGLREIFNSGDPILIPALLANIRAFQIAARREKEILGLKGRVKKLEEKCDKFDEIKERLETLERNLPTAAGAGGL